MDDEYRALLVAHQQMLDCVKQGDIRTLADYAAQLNASDMFVAGVLDYAVMLVRQHSRPKGTSLH